MIIFTQWHHDTKVFFSVVVQRIFFLSSDWTPACRRQGWNGFFCFLIAGKLIRVIRVIRWCFSVIGLIGFDEFFCLAQAKGSVALISVNSWTDSFTWFSFGPPIIADSFVFPLVAQGCFGQARLYERVGQARVYETISSFYEILSPNYKFISGQTRLPGYWTKSTGRYFFFGMRNDNGKFTFSIFLMTSFLRNKPETVF